MWHVPPDFWKDVFLAILQFPFSPWKNTQKHRFELSILNFWAPRNLIRNIVPLILKSLGSQRSNHQHQHLKVSVFHPIFDHFQYFPIHFWDDLRIPDLGESYLLCNLPCCSILFLCVTGDLVRCQHVDGYLTCPQRELWQLHWHHTKCEDLSIHWPFAKFCIACFWFVCLFICLFVGWFVLDLSIFRRTNC